LCARADVVIENFRPGGAPPRLDYDASNGARSNVVYWHDQWLRPSRAARRPGYDFVIPGRVRPDVDHGRAGKGPMKVGVSVVDGAAASTRDGDRRRAPPT